MLEGKCLKCGAHYVGWALRFPRHQTCDKCGGALDITADGHIVSRGYSPFTAERYYINLPTDVPPPCVKPKRGRSQHKRSRS